MLNKILATHIKINFVFLILGLFFGLLYSLDLLGFGSELIRPDLVRSLHISLMLYGFATVILSILPFSLFQKDGISSESGEIYLNVYFIVWEIFLVFLVFSILMGNIRGLAFYDFVYELNYILAFSGLFYILSIISYVRSYEVKPLWVKISLFVVIISPFLLLLLMNPEYGQVEKMPWGPHGDNTLGMSFALLVLYFLSIKLFATRDFVYRWNILWIIPFTLYLGSVLYRSFISDISYSAEWFLQYLTLLYVPMLYRWWMDAGLNIKKHYLLFIALLAFVFVDIEGNILFIPEIRSLFHRNDLVVGHSHIAVGISMLFLTLSLASQYVKLSFKLLVSWAILIVLMSLVLSINGFYQAGFLEVDSVLMWQMRSFFGLLIFISSFWLFDYKNIFSNFTPLRVYHQIGFLSDGIGGLFLILFASIIYPFLGEEFVGGYQYVVFAFVTSIGIMHFIGLVKNEWAMAIAFVTLFTRVLVSSMFFALFKSEVFGMIALLIALYDLFYVAIFLIYFKRQVYEIFTR